MSYDCYLLSCDLMFNVMSLVCQGSLEEVTEMLAEVVARPHLRKPRQEIIRLTREAREKRRRFIDEIKYGESVDTLTRTVTHAHIHTHSHAQSHMLTLTHTHSDVSSVFLRPRQFPWLHDSSHDLDEPRNSRRYSDLDWRSHDRSHGTKIPHDSDNDLLQILELSKQEFEVERQLKEGV